jgi:hypothetical protein
LAQHLDDLAESFMMSVMHNGFLRTMKAHYRVNAGDLSVIRPLAYCRESVMTEFAKSANLPVINENCPACFEEPKERARIKKLLSREETLFPNFFDNIKRSILPLMHDDTTPILRAYTKEALAKSWKENKVKKRPNGSDSSNSKKVKAEPMEDGENDEKRIDSIPPPMESDDAKSSTFLADASEEELIRELARRKADRYRLAGSMQQGLVDQEDPTGQVCTLNGGDGISRYPSPVAILVFRRQRRPFRFGSETWHPELHWGGPSKTPPPKPKLNSVPRISTPEWWAAMPMGTRQTLAGDKP